MNSEKPRTELLDPQRFSALTVPAIIANEGDHAARRFLEFFTATIRNLNTRAAYARAVGQFLRWCEKRGMQLRDIEPIAVAAYIEWLLHREEEPLAAPTVKQHLAAIRMLFDWLVIGQILAFNPAASVRGPKHVVKKGKTLVLSAQDARVLLDSIPIRIGPEPEPGADDTRPPDLVGLRDRALIALMCYSFARIGAVVGMRVEDYYQNGKRWWVRLHEKGGKFHELHAHHKAEEYLDAYREAAGIANQGKAPLFQSVAGKTGRLTGKALNRRNALHMVKRRVRAAGLSERVCNHSFRATGITVFIEKGGPLERAQRIACHESPKTTKLYDRSGDDIALDDIERIVI